MSSPQEDLHKKNKSNHVPQAPHERKGLKFSKPFRFQQSSTEPNVREDRQKLKPHKYSQQRVKKWEVGKKWESSTAPLDREDRQKLKPHKLPPERVEKWEVGKKSELTAKTRFHSHRIREKEELLSEVAQASARGEMLCTEDTGFLEAENTNRVTQWDIKQDADEMTQQKIFDLHLKQFGPYRMDYTRNGRHLLIGGQKGHIAAFDWQAKKLHCEINVMETIADVKWFHQETMFAVAQRKWTYVYDNQGIELHCLKYLDSTQRLEFLPYHFLMVSSSSKGYLSYLDISVGKEVAGIRTRKGRLDIMKVNPQSAVVSLGHSDGTVSFWIPSMKEAAAKFLCHNSGLRDLSFDATGRYLATTGMDRRLKIFDVRMFRELSRYQYAKRYCPNLVDFSQKGLLAVTRDNIVEVYKGMTELSEKPERAYMYHQCDRLVADMSFCPYEDVLGMGHSAGFSSIVIPGSGEANFDARESNPFQTKSQRKETEVRMLLDKVKPEMIALDSEIGQIDLQTSQEQKAEMERTKYIKPDRIDHNPRNRMKGGSSGLKLVQRKKGHKEDVGREAVRNIVRTKQMEGKFEERKKKRESGSVLDRLKRVVNE